MPANKMNYLVLYRGDSQVYGAGSKDIALSSPPPAGFQLEDKVVLFVSQEPDTDQLIVRQVPREEILSAEIKEPKARKIKEDA